MRWRTSIVAPSAALCALIGISAGGMIGGCGSQSYMRGLDAGGTGGTGGTGDGTGGSVDASGGAPGGGGDGQPVATGGRGAAGSGGTVGSGGGTATGGGPASGGTGAAPTGTGGGGGVGGTGAASGGATAATGGRASGGAAATGGSGSGGRGTGGANTGGASTGGANTGGASTGGANTGGANTGGANTGGANTGGANTGGSATGGAGTGGAAAPTGAILYYPFDETTGTTVADQSGNAAAGTINGGGTFGAGMVRNGLTFAGGTSTGTYVTIPVGLLTSVRDMTISLWVKVTTDRTWQRILDFSKSTTTGYMFLTTHAASANTVRFAITATGIGGEQQIEVPLLPLNTWKHLALVFSSTGVSFFVDGVKVTTSTALTLRPMDVGVLANQWLGRSAFTSDPYFAGQLDELRIYGRALSDAEVGVLYSLR